MESPREDITPPTDLYQKALDIKNYFELMDFCEKMVPGICENPNFWKEKLLEDFPTLINEQNIINYYGNQFKAKYQAMLSDTLLRAVIYKGHSGMNEEAKAYYNEIDDLYGDDEEKLEASRELRKEANKEFPMEYDKNLYEIYVQDDPDDPEYGPTQWYIDEEKKRLGIGNKPGQLILIYNLEEIPKKYQYFYQLGDEVSGWITKYPEISDEIY